jgi:hypothetical protein
VAALATLTATAAGSAPERRGSDASSSAQSSPPLKRKTLSSANSGGHGTSLSTLANLVPKVMAGGASPANGTHDDASAASYPVIQPDDFWKHLREWDFCTYYYNSVTSDNSQQPNQTDSTSMLKPLPNTFLNHRHYAAAWAPLVLAECRAQILQEWATTGRNMDASGVLVNVESTHGRGRASQQNYGGGNGGGYLSMADEIESGGHVILTIPRGAARRGPPVSFMNGDVCLLIQPQHASLLSDLARGRKVSPLPGKDIGDYSGISLIGHTESSRSELQGLVLKVSKRKWARAGKKEMIVIKLGSNVTSLREFTALARVETLPMKKFLFGQHLGDSQRVKKLSRHQSADALFKKMGGTSALGEGFVKYATDKFNASQLTAIAASANEYGDGGFTLIKGPPGTGSTCRLRTMMSGLFERFSPLVFYPTFRDNHPCCRAQLSSYPAVQQILRRSPKDRRYPNRNTSSGVGTRASRQTPTSGYRAIQCRR